MVPCKMQNKPKICWGECGRTSLRHTAFPLWFRNNFQFPVANLRFDFQLIPVKGTCESVGINVQYCLYLKGNAGMIWNVETDKINNETGDDLGKRPQLLAISHSEPNVEQWLFQRSQLEVLTERQFTVPAKRRPKPIVSSKFPHSCSRLFAD